MTDACLSWDAMLAAACITDCPGTCDDCPIMSIIDEGSPCLAIQRLSRYILTHRTKPCEPPEPCDMQCVSCDRIEGTGQC